MRVVGGCFVEGLIPWAERAEDFVGRDVDEAKGIARGARERTPVSEGSLEELECPGDVSSDEFPWAIDGTIDMGLGCEMQDFFGLMFRQDSAQGLAVADIGLHEREAGLAFKIGERGTITGVGQFVDDGHLVAGGMREPREIGADEAGAASDEEFHGVIDGRLGPRGRLKPEAFRPRIRARFPIVIMIQQRQNPRA